MKNRYIIILLASLLFMTCSSKKENKNQKNVLQNELNKERNIIKILITNYNFNDIKEGVSNRNYILDSSGFIQTIRIRNQKIDSVPKEIFELKKIKSLSLFNCQFTDIPKGIHNIKTLEFLALGKNPIKKITNVKIPNTLNSIVLSKCPLEKFPHFTKENDSIPYKLFLPDTFIDSIPDFVGDMNLKALWLERCPITYISPNLGNCENMEGLYFEANPFLKEFPASLAKLKKMRKIHFNWLPIKKIPDFVYEWPELEAIKVNNCFIEELSPKVGNLKKLRFLVSKGNKIKYLPASLGQVTNLEYVSFEGCPIELKSIPAGFFPERDLPQEDLPTLYVNVPNCYDCFSVPEEQVRKSFRIF